MTGEKRVVPCPHCGKSVYWGTESRYRPFCSERCKMVDLGAWANEAYRMPVDTDPDRQEAEHGVKETE